MIEHTVVCDRCSATVAASSKSPADARRAAAASGAGRHRGRDLCWTCLPEAVATDAK